MLTAFDYAVSAMIVFSMLRGAWRGFVSEIFGLIGWIAAIVIASRYVGMVVPYIPVNWPGGALTQWVIAFALIVIGVVLVVGVTNALLSRIAQASSLGGIDRSLGMMFGLVRGCVLSVLLVAAAGLTELPKQDFWRNALLRPFAEQGVHELKQILPDGMSQYVRV